MFCVRGQFLLNVRSLPDIEFEIGIFNIKVLQYQNDLYHSMYVFNIKVVLVLHKIAWAADSWVITVTITILGLAHLTQPCIKVCIHYSISKYSISKYPISKNSISKHSISKYSISKYLISKYSISFHNYLISKYALILKLLISSDISY